jgi:hypothetical protein
MKSPLVDRLKAKYRSLWDSYQVIAHRNVELVRTERQPSNEQLIAEQKAAESVALARDELLAAISAADTPS